MNNLTIEKHGDLFYIDDKSRCGSPPIGYGKSLYEALGMYIHNNQEFYNINFIVDKSTKQDENKRRKQELAKR